LAASDAADMPKKEVFRMRSIYRRNLPTTATWSIPTIIAVALAASVGLTGCTKDAEEADKFPSREAAKPLDAGELTTIRLANGITAYLQEEHTKPEIAVEVLYGAGVIHEGEGKTQVSRILPHMLIFSPTASFKADGAVDQVQKVGRINGEVATVFTNFDYTVSTGNLDLILQVEAERFSSVVFTDDQKAKYAQKCQDDIDTVLEKEQLSLSKYGLMAFNQIYNYGKTSVPVYHGVHNITLDDIKRFHREKYRLENMVIVVVGDFNTDEAIALIKKRFEHLEERPATKAKPARPVATNVTARWDLPANALFFVFPGPYKNVNEQLVLTMFGSLLNRQLMASADLIRDVSSTYCSSQVVPVGDMPFFVFAEAKPGRRLEDINPSVVLVVDETMRLITEKMFNAMKTNMISYVESSIFKAQMNLSNISHFQVIGQEALNVGMKHFLREGRSVEEFVEIVQSITYEEAGSYIESRLTLENMKTVAIQEK
jgi:predicted Zn-dependent peptidase